MRSFFYKYLCSGDPLFSTIWLDLKAARPVRRKALIVAILSWPYKKFRGPLEQSKVFMLTPSLSSSDGVIDPVNCPLAYSGLLRAFPPNRC